MCHEHQTSLHWAWRLDIAYLLIEHGAEVEAEDKSGRTVYKIVLDKGRDEVD